MRGVTSTTSQVYWPDLTGLKEEDDDENNVAKSWNVKIQYSKVTCMKIMHKIGLLVIWSWLARGNLVDFQVPPGNVVLVVRIVDHVDD